jgi:hypothetical protein
MRTGGIEPPEKIKLKIKGRYALTLLFAKTIKYKGIHVTFRPRKKRIDTLQKVLFSFFS